MLPQSSQTVRPGTLLLRVSAVVLIFSIVVLGFALPAVADSTYTYKGQPYSPVPPSFCNGTYVPVCTQLAVTGFFTTAAPLGDNLDNYTFTPLSFSFNDGAGVFALTSAQGLPLATFQVTTDASGNILGWSVGLSNNAADCVSVSGLECLGTYNNNFIPGQSSDFSAYAFNLNTPSQTYGGGKNLGTPGTWVNLPQQLPNLPQLSCSP